MKKSYWYNENDGSLTGDLYLKIDEKTYAIEVDEPNHLTKKSRTNGGVKNKIIKRKKDTVLIRCHNLN
jgi:hypothetical protein